MAVAIQDWFIQVQDILLTIDLIEAYLRDHTIDSFPNDHKTIVLTCYNLRLIGEAACAIPREARDRHKNIPWVQLRNLRNPVSDNHFRQNPRILWMVCNSRVLPVAEKLATILNSDRDYFKDCDGPGGSNLR